MAMAAIELVSSARSDRALSVATKTARVRILFIIVFDFMVRLVIELNRRISFFFGADPYRIIDG